MKPHRHSAGGEARVAEAHMPEDRSSGTIDAFDIVLQPVSHPELGDIRIDDNLFAIGRTEPPFDAYAADLVVDLSRRHARIFCEHGAVYIADLDSKNGTTVNDVDIRQKTARLQQGDEICFGGALSYRVKLGVRAQHVPVPAARFSSLTLTPERDDLGLQPILLTQFPFLVSKADETFSRYRKDYPHQVNYLSRRHAHIFLKGGTPWIEDLGSTNGTFVDAKRLDEHAVALEEGSLIAFGGHHFVYKASLHYETADVEPTVTKLGPMARAIAEAGLDADKTRFVAQADSFLDIFCVDHAQRQDDELNDDSRKPADEAGAEPDKRGRVAVFLSELRTALGGFEEKKPGRVKRVGAAIATALVALALALYFSGGAERELKDLMADGDYARAAEVAGKRLDGDPDNAQIRALGTEALLKAQLPPWLDAIKARQYDRAASILTDMKARGRTNPELQPLLGELEWIGEIERFVTSRGGSNAPIRIYADEAKIAALLKHWDEDTQGHQWALSTVAVHVPAFRDVYAEALTRLRKMQSDDAAYLAAIDRLKGVIATELNRNRPEALAEIFDEYAEKYPRLAGIDALRQDLRQYTEIESHARARRAGPLIALMAKAKFETPPFQEKFRALASGGELPSPDMVRQYQAVSKAWREGDTAQAFDGLQKMASGGPWADAAASQLARKKAIVEQFGVLQQARNAQGYDERLLAFYGSLEPDEDTYYIHAVDGDIAKIRDKALKRAQELLERAQASWRKYRDNGPIEGGQRVESPVSAGFRAQARLLSAAREDARQGMRILGQLKAERPAQSAKAQEEIEAEAEQQRRSLLALRDVLEPKVLKEKLALIGGASDGERQPAATAD
jgi:pSer/pThr/pTyr-binding forkhead associated (FHA) protein